nr:ATP-binding protein [Paenibacillus rigui]
MKERFAAFLLMLIAVPLAGEVKFYPFHDDFRISLGTPVFFFFLLWIRQVAPVLSGLAVGACVALFRIGWDTLFHGSELTWGSLFQLHYPVFFYYLTYACLFQLLRMNREPYRPLRVGALDIVIETVSSFAELSVRHSVAEEWSRITVYGEIILIALIRSFFVLGFYNIIQLRQAVLNEEQQRAQNEQVLVMISNLYEESVQLQKTLGDAESITRDCYDLYRSLQELDPADAAQTKALAQKALLISGQVHDIKKDNQRIYAGLAKLINEESTADYMEAGQIGELIVRTNRKYAAALGKSVQFQLHVEAVLPALQVFTVLSLVNNLAANAVEAIRQEGIVWIEARLEQEWLLFRVADNGPGIADKRRERIFTPGYTTKYDAAGQPSTGMGLFYIRQVAEGLGGRIVVEEELREGESTALTICLPLHKLTKKG